MATLPPHSRSLPDLSRPEDLDPSFELDYPDQPPSPAWSRSRSPSPFAEELEHGDDGELRYVSSGKGGAARGGREREREPRFEEDEGEDEGEGERSVRFEAAAAEPEQDLDDYGPSSPDPPTRERAERSPSFGSIHSAPELASPTRPTAGPDQREAEAETVSPSPSSPVEPRRELDGQELGEKKRRKLPSTLWDYLQEEVRLAALRGRGRWRGGNQEREGDQLPGGAQGAREGVFHSPLTPRPTAEKGAESPCPRARPCAQIIIFGVFICLDSFLYTFTILPLRSLTALLQLLSNVTYNVFYPSKRKRHLRLSHKCDLTKAVILAGTLAALHRLTDASKMYHGVRGQETIKLYVLLITLAPAQIADRLCCSFGQDLQDSLFSRATLSRRRDGSHPHIRPLALFVLTWAYVVAHSLVLFYQLVTLNVAINSYSNALLTLLLSNQFVEIKGSVFKKFEKENLFQLTCAGQSGSEFMGLILCSRRRTIDGLSWVDETDIVERFQLALMLFIIALRNLIELSSASTTATTTPSSSLSPSFLSFLPSAPSFSLPTLSLLRAIFSPAVIVLVSECFVDWLKHAFITKFNHIRPQVYGRFVDVLCMDLVAGGRGGRTKGGSDLLIEGGGISTASQAQQPFVDQSPLVARRLGFAALPLGCLVVRVIAQAFEMLADDSGVDECAPPRGLSGGSRAGGGGKAMERGGEDVWAKVGGWLAVGGTVGVLWICLVALKLLIGINLRAFASERWSTMSTREDEEELNGRKRDKIGVSDQEKVIRLCLRVSLCLPLSLPPVSPQLFARPHHCPSVELTLPLPKASDEQTTALLSSSTFDARGAAAKGDKITLATLSRYDMVRSRLW
ncbi:SPOSA6832_04523, partial [Sporobolomyces salmonicolor]